MRLASERQPFLETVPTWIGALPIPQFVAVTTALRASIG
jgi:hypothetical protein